MTASEIKTRMARLGFTREQLYQIWLEVYVLSTKKEDLHAKFAERLKCTRNEAKSFSYMLTYTSPYLYNMLRQTRMVSYEMIKEQLMRSGDKVSVENYIQRTLNHLEYRTNQYMEKYRTIDPNYV